MPSLLRRVLPLLLILALAACLPEPTVAPAALTPAALTPAASATPASTPTLPPTATVAPSAAPMMPTPYPPLTALDAAATAYPQPTTAAAYPPPTAGAAATAYPALEQDAMSPNQAIVILDWQPSERWVQVRGTSTLPDGACILTALTINERPAAWWPAEQCATVRDGQWLLRFERAPLGPADPPGARYALTARAPDHPEAGEARYWVQAFIPYHGGGN